MPAHLLCYEPNQHDLTDPDLRLLTYVKWPGRPPPTTVYLKAYLAALRARPDKLPQKRDAAPPELLSLLLLPTGQDRPGLRRPRSADWVSPPPPFRLSLLPALARPVQFLASSLSPSRSQRATWSFAHVHARLGLTRPCGRPDPARLGDARTGHLQPVAGPSELVTVDIEADTTPPPPGVPARTDAATTIDLTEAPVDLEASTTTSSAADATPEPAQSMPTVANMPAPASEVLSQPTGQDAPLQSSAATAAAATPGSGDAPPLTPVTLTPLPTSDS